MKKNRPYGSWRSPVTAELATANIRGFSFVEHAQDCLIWTEARPSEGREALVRWKNGEQVDLTPPPYSVRSRVHEYGGKAFAVSGGHFWFVNADDQNIYYGSINRPADVSPLVIGDASERFGELVLDSKHRRLYAIREKHGDNRQVENDICSVDLQTGKVTSAFSGHDFYIAPRISPSGSRVAFLAWDHPNMPWDGTQLYVAELESGSRRATLVTGDATTSICEPSWVNEDKLAFVSDANGFWNLHIYDESGIESIAPEDVEYGFPQWNFGGRHYLPLDDRYFVATRNDPEGKSLVIVDSVTKLISPYEETFSSYGALTNHDDDLVFVAGQDDGFAQIVCKKRTSGDLVTIATASDTQIRDDMVSRPELMKYTGSQCSQVYAYFYRPCNGEYEADASSRPPLLVLSHGGPTASTSPDFSFRIQYYTSRGWAVLDVNYGGSTGYGREYRERLKGNWGIVDVGDCVSGVRDLIARDEIDPQKVAIKGGSAGGYTTLQALTTSTVFKVGSSLYGVADARILAADTHKFESLYIEQLIPEDQIDERSPIHHTDSLNCPIIFFQGVDDKVVPPNQATLMFEKLKEKGIPTALFLFAGEGHGFRKAENIKTCMEAEYLFFAKVFNIEVEDADYSCFAHAQLANLDLS